MGSKFIDLLLKRIHYKSQGKYKDLVIKILLEDHGSQYQLFVKADDIKQSFGMIDETSIQNIMQHSNRVKMVDTLIEVLVLEKKLGDFLNSVLSLRIVTAWKNMPYDTPEDEVKDLTE